MVPTWRPVQSDEDDFSSPTSQYSDAESTSEDSRGSRSSSSSDEKERGGSSDERKSEEEGGDREDDKEEGSAENEGHEGEVAERVEEKTEHQAPVPKTEKKVCGQRYDYHSDQSFYSPTNAVRRPMRFRYQQRKPRKRYAVDTKHVLSSPLTLQSSTILKQSKMTDDQRMSSSSDVEIVCTVPKPSAPPSEIEAMSPVSDEGGLGNDEDGRVVGVEATERED